MPFNIFFIVGLLAIFLVSWFFGYLASKLSGSKLNVVHSSLIGLVSVIFGFIVCEYTEDWLKDSSSFVLFIISSAAFGWVLIYFTEKKQGKVVEQINTRREISMDNGKSAGHYVFDSETGDNSNSDGNKERGSIVSDIRFKNLVRIPVWAIYSLIVATVIISFIILTEIWFPDTIDEELIWKIALTYGVFLMSALVISNLTDRIKEINKSS